MQLKEFLKVERAADLSRTEVGRLGTAILFIVAVIIYTGTSFSHIEQSYMLIAAAVIGAYMAMNIGANDVANNVGPAVGSFAITLTSAIAIAAIFEAAGAMIAGGDVVRTVKKGIIDPADIDDPEMFVWVMMAALLGAAHLAQPRHRDRRAGFDDPFDRRRRHGRRHRGSRLGRRQLGQRWPRSPRAGSSRRSSAG